MLYLHDKKLVILGNRYKARTHERVDYMDRAYPETSWFNRENKTVVIVYDISDISDLRLEYVELVDGSLLRSRRIGDKLYVLSQNHFHIPYWSYTHYKDDAYVFDEDAFEGDLEQQLQASFILPKKAEIRPSDDLDFTSKDGKHLPFSLSSDFAADCSSVQYVLPDTETQQQFNISPNFVTLSVVDLTDTSEPAESHVVFGNISEIHMSLDSLYLTSSVYSTTPFRCPDNRLCIMPYYQTRNNTVIHKFDIEQSGLAYEASNIVPGSPLTQYSMSE